MQITDNKLFIPVFDRSPVNKFTRIDRLPGMRDKYVCSVILPLQKSLSNLEVNEAIDLSWMRLYYITSLSVLCGYGFEMPGLNILIKDTRILVRKNDGQYFKNVKVQFTNKDFSIFNSEDRAMAVFLNTEEKI